MSDETYAFLKEASKRRRAGNRHRAPGILRKHGISFDSWNNGAHLRIYVNDKAIADFWPGTGKWIVPSKGRGRGIFNLIALLADKE